MTRLDDADGVAARAAQVGQAAGDLVARPVPAGRPPPQGAALDQLAEQLEGARAEPVELLEAQRQLGGGGAQVRRQDVRVGGVEDGRLDGGVEDRLGVVHQERVERVLARDEGDEPVGARPARAPGLLPERHARARPAGDEHGVETGDVDAELEGVRRRQGQQRPGADRVLQRAPLLGQVAAAVRRDRRAPATGRSPRGARGSRPRRTRRRGATA